MDQTIQQQLTDLLRANSMTPDTLHGPTLTQLFPVANAGVALWRRVFHSHAPLFFEALRPIDRGHPGGCGRGGRPGGPGLPGDLFSQGQALCQGQDRFPVPGREYPAPFEDLIYAVAELLQPLLDRAKKLALCVPFPVDYDSRGTAPSAGSPAP